MTAHPVIHLLHDVGAATWFGGTLAGAVALNGSAAQLSDPAERARVSTVGWSRWAPVGAAGMVAHVIGAAALTATDRRRIVAQKGVAASSAAKAAVTVAGLGAHAWSAALNRKMADAGAVPVQGATEPGAATPPDVARTQQQLKLAQWINPLLGGTVIALGAVQEEQQRASQQASGVLRRTAGAVPRAAGAVPLPVMLPAVGALALLVARRRRRRSVEVVEVVSVDGVREEYASGAEERPTDLIDLTAGEQSAHSTAGAPARP